MAFKMNGINFGMGTGSSMQDQDFISPYSKKTYAEAYETAKTKWPETYGHMSLDEYTTEAKRQKTHESENPGDWDVKNVPKKKEKKPSVTMQPTEYSILSSKAKRTLSRPIATTTTTTTKKDKKKLKDTKVGKFLGVGKGEERKARRAALREKRMERYKSPKSDPFS